jgi:tetratricopeptide (TPR) repeat protein
MTNKTMAYKPISPEIEERARAHHYDREAALEYLEALRLADSMIIPADHADEIRQMYEPIIEAQQAQSDEAALRRVSENISGFLLRPDWRDQLNKVREQMPKPESGAMMPLADMLLQAQSTQVLDSINRVHELARGGYLRSAMDEAFEAVQRAPTYLPLHTLIGDLLIQEGRTQDAITKFGVTAEAYSVRGEAASASKLLRRVIQLAPMDLGARSRLIDQLVSRGQMDDAITEYLQLADLYYRLAELDMARKTYTTALRVVQQSRDRTDRPHPPAHRISIRRLTGNRPAHLRTDPHPCPDDDRAPQHRDLNLRMGQKGQAIRAGGFRSLESHGERDHRRWTFQDHEGQIGPTALADNSTAGRTEDASPCWMDWGYCWAGNTKKHYVIRQIIKMNPPGVEDRKLLAQIQLAA